MRTNRLPCANLNPQKNTSLVQREVAFSLENDGRIVNAVLCKMKISPSKRTTPQSASLTAPLTQGRLKSGFVLAQFASKAPICLIRSAEFAARAIIT